MSKYNVTIIDTVNMSIRLMYLFKIVFVLEVILLHDLKYKKRDCG